jgi:hypothetical protein
VRIERKAGAVVAVLGSLLLAVSGAVPAFAHTGPSAGRLHVSGAQFARVANATNTGLAGWVFGAKAAKSVTAEFKVPTLKCTSKTSGVAPSSVLVTGSTSAAKVSAATVLLACSGGKPLAIPAVIVDNTETNGTQKVHTGDLMKATVTTTATKTTATLADLTKGHTFTLTKSGKGGASFEELLVDTKVQMGSTVLPVANFGTISYSNGAVSGKALGSVKPSMAVNMVNKKKVLQILTGPLTGTKKNAFKTTWKHS